MATSRQIAALVEPCSTLSLENGEPHEVAVVPGALHASARAPIEGSWPDPHPAGLHRLCPPRGLLWRACSPKAMVKTTISSPH
jgi:hypothetical protein